MKLKIHLKDPRGLYDAIHKAAQESLGNQEIAANEYEMRLLDRVIELEYKIENWVKDSGITIEFDLDKNTAVVCRV